MAENVLSGDLSVLAMYNQKTIPDLVNIQSWKQEVTYVDSCRQVEKIFLKKAERKKGKKKTSGPVVRKRDLPVKKDMEIYRTIDRT